MSKNISPITEYMSQSLPSYEEKMLTEYGLSPTEVEQHEKELKEFYNDKLAAEEWESQDFIDYQKENLMFN